MAVRTAQSKEAGRAPLPLTSRLDKWWIKPMMTVIALSYIHLTLPTIGFVYQFLVFGS